MSHVPERFLQTIPARDDTWENRLVKAQTGEGPKAGERKSPSKDWRARPGLGPLELLKQVRTQLKATLAAPTMGERLSSTREPQSVRINSEFAGSGQAPCSPGPQSRIRTRT